MAPPAPSRERGALCSTANTSWMYATLLVAVRVHVASHAAWLGCAKESRPSLRNPYTGVTSLDFTHPPCATTTPGVTEPLKWRPRPALKCLPLESAEWHRSVPSGPEAMAP